VRKPELVGHLVRMSEESISGENRRKKKSSKTKIKVV
jgi:hypothetical protein